MDKQGIKPTTDHMLIAQKKYNTYLCHICGKTLGSMDTLKIHLNCHTDETYKCPMCKYTSPRMDVIRRDSSRHKIDKKPPRLTMALETKPYQANQSSVNSYLYQQTMPQNKQTFPWILHEHDTLPPRIVRPCHINEPIIIPHEAVKQLPDPRLQWENIETTETMEETTSISSEIDQTLNQKCEISTCLSELNYMLRQLEAYKLSHPQTTQKEETETWTVLDSFETIAMDKI